MAGAGDAVSGVTQRKVAAKQRQSKRWSTEIHIIQNGSAGDQTTETRHRGKEKVFICSIPAQLIKARNINHSPGQIH
jgi:hypothetical protein